AGLLAPGYVWRQRAGPGVTLDAYLRRFPEYAARPGPGRAAGCAAPTAAALAAPPPGPPSPAPPPTRRPPPPPRPPHARGGLGEVHLAEDAELGRPVALKRIQERHLDDPESSRRFLREAEITARLEHPGIVPVYGLAQDPQGQLCYAMRFIEGESLQDALDRFHADGRDPGERSLALRQLLARFVVVCNTLAYAHSKGVVHRDLKPANVM